MVVFKVEIHHYNIVLCLEHNWALKGLTGHFLNFHIIFDSAVLDQQFYFDFIVVPNVFSLSECVCYSVVLLWISCRFSAGSTFPVGDNKSESVVYQTNWQLNDCIS